jgi:transcriptional regulator with XRE-family HTH domain
MRRTSLTKRQADALARILRDRRAGLGLTIRQLEADSGVNVATIVRLERGEILAPQPDTLKALARPLDLTVADLFAVTEWLPAEELPTLKPYLRAKYHDLDERAITDLERFVDQITRRYGDIGPIDREDER